MTAGETIRIRDIAATSGEIARGFLTIGETPTAPIQIPIVIINGTRPGPTLCLTAGVHAADIRGSTPCCGRSSRSILIVSVER